MSSKNSSQAPTAWDVARLAGVSQSTVSLVLAEKADGRVSPNTQEAVLRAARQLNYFPNAAARSLRTGRASAVALVVPDAMNPFFGPVFYGAEQAARVNDHTVVLVNADNSQDWQQILLDTLSAHALDGFVLWPGPPGALGPELEGLEQKVVVVEARPPNVPSVRIDVEGGARAALEHLLELGHTKIAHLAPDLNLDTFEVRRAQYRRVLSETGIPFPEEYEQRATLTVEDSRKAARGLLQLDDRPSAVFCDDDLMAVGAYKAARDLGLKIPYDLSITGFDDVEIARVVEPELTTVAIPAEYVGRRAIALLLAALEEVETTPQTVRSELVPTELVVRGSTAPPMRGAEPRTASNR